jgi:hypothetical protein
MKRELDRITALQLEKPDTAISVADGRLVCELAKTLIQTSKEQRAIRAEMLDDIANGKADLDTLVDEVIAERQKYKYSKRKPKRDNTNEDTATDE